jgi:ribose transport system substrate-binding protein
MNDIFKICMLFILAVMLLAGCGGSSDKNDSGQRPVIGVSVLTLQNPFFRDLGDAMAEEAEKLGYDIVITAGDFDIGRQRNQVSDFIVQRVAAIVLCPQDSRAIGTSIREANQTGIPVFTADIAVLADDVDIVSHIATNNYQAGQIAAEAVIEAIGGRGKVGIIDHPEVESVIMRTNGFMDKINSYNNEHGRNIQIVSRLPGGGAQDRSFRAAEDMLQAHADLNAIFAINDPSALGAVAAVERAGKEGRVKIVGVDGMPEVRQAIKDGKIYATAIQFPENIGRMTVQKIHSYMQGERVEAEYLITTELYRQEDALEDVTLR